jgi:N6-adenosine-specific RNA methylase IME4
MTDAELMTLPVGHLVRQHALLLYWTTGWAVATGRAQAIVRAWGAEPVTEIVWIKTTKNDKVRIGTGYRVRTMHEPILLAKWGNPEHKPFPSSFRGLARRHSEKPTEFYHMVVAHTLGRVRCDLFSAGIQRPGFEGWGSDHRTAEAQSDHGARQRTEEHPAQFFGSTLPI